MDCCSCALTQWTSVLSGQMSVRWTRNKYTHGRILGVQQRTNRSDMIHSTKQLQLSLSQIRIPQPKGTIKGKPFHIKRTVNNHQAMWRIQRKSNTQWMTRSCDECARCKPVADVMCKLCIRQSVLDM
eukprot:288081_1